MGREDELGEGGEEDKKQNGVHTKPESNITSFKQNLDQTEYGSIWDLDQTGPGQSGHESSKTWIQQNLDQSGPQSQRAWIKTGPGSN